jgi:tRNA (Thr-GGU) A37 N-methylase
MLYSININNELNFEGTKNMSAYNRIILLYWNPRAPEYFLHVRQVSMTQRS